MFKFHHRTLAEPDEREEGDDIEPINRIDLLNTLEEIGDDHGDVIELGNMVHFAGHGPVAFEEFEELVTKWAHDPDNVQDINDADDDEPAHEEEPSGLGAADLFKQYAREKEERKQTALENGDPPPTVEQEEEHAAAAEEEVVTILSESAQIKWDELDADGSGELSGSEIDHLAEWVFYSFRPDHIAMTEEEHFTEAEKILARCDVNGDRSIDRHEFGKYYEQTASQIFKFAQAQEEKRIASENVAKEKKAAKAKKEAEYALQEERYAMGHSAGGESPEQKARREWRENNVPAAIRAAGDNTPKKNDPAYANLDDGVVSYQENSPDYDPDHDYQAEQEEMELSGPELFKQYAREKEAKRQDALDSGDPPPTAKEERIAQEEVSFPCRSRVSNPISVTMSTSFANLAL